MFTRLTEHAMRVAVFLGDAPDRSHAEAAIVAGTRIAAGDVAGVLAALVAAGVVLEVPGLETGWRLARPPAQVTMLDIVQSTQPLERIQMCPLGLEGHGPNLCPLHRRMDNAVLALQEAFRRSTIAQLLVEPTTSKPLCNFPRVAAS